MILPRGPLHHSYSQRLLLFQRTCAELVSRILSSTLIEKPQIPQIDKRTAYWQLCVTLHRRMHISCCWRLYSKISYLSSRFNDASDLWRVTPFACVAYSSHQAFDTNMPTFMHSCGEFAIMSSSAQSVFTSHTRNMNAETEHMHQVSEPNQWMVKFVCR